MHARLGGTVNRAEAFICAQNRAHDRRRTGLSDEVTSQRCRKARLAKKRGVQPGIFVAGHLVRKNPGDTAGPHRADQLGDTPRCGGHQLSPCALTTTMHELIELFQSNGFIQGH